MNLPVLSWTAAEATRNVFGWLRVLDTVLLSRSVGNGRLRIKRNVGLVIRVDAINSEAHHAAVFLDEIIDLFKDELLKAHDESKLRQLFMDDPDEASKRVKEMEDAEIQERRRVDSLCLASAEHTTSPVLPDSDKEWRYIRFYYACEYLKFVNSFSLAVSRSANTDQPQVFQILLVEWWAFAGHLRWKQHPMASYEFDPHQR